MIKIGKISCHLMTPIPIPPMKLSLIYTIEKGFGFIKVIRLAFVSPHFGKIEAF